MKYDVLITKLGSQGVKCATMHGVDEAPRAVSVTAPAPKRANRAVLRCFRGLKLLWSAGGTPLVEPPPDHDEEALAEVEINIQAIVLYKLRHAKRPLVAAQWVTIGLVAALLELSAMYGLTFSVVQTPCLYQEDCRLGYACVSTDVINATTPAANGWSITPVTTVCEGCDFITGIYTGVWVQSGAGADKFHLTPRTANGFVTGSNTSEFCEAQMRTPDLATWPTRPSHSTICPHVLQSMMMLTLFGKVVLAAAFVFISASIGAERKQQLINRHIRLQWFPPAHRSPRAFCLFVIDTVLSRGVIPQVVVALLALLSTSGFGPQDVLLTGLSISFVLVIDDELACVAVSSVEQARIEEAMRAALKGARDLTRIHRQSYALSVWVVLCLGIGMAVLTNTTCTTGLVLLITVVWNLCGPVGGTILDMVVQAHDDYRYAPPAARTDWRKQAARMAATELLGTTVAIGCLTAVWMTSAWAAF